MKKIQYQLFRSFQVKGTKYLLLQTDDITVFLPLYWQVIECVLVDLMLLTQCSAPTAELLLHKLQCVIILSEYAVVPSNLCILFHTHQTQTARSVNDTILILIHFLDCHSQKCIQFLLPNLWEAQGVMYVLYHPLTVTSGNKWSRGRGLTKTPSKRGNTSWWETEVSNFVAIPFFSVW